MGGNKRLVQMANLPLNPTWIKQTQILFSRNLREVSRKLNVIIISIIQTIIMALMIGFVFLNIGHAQTSIVRREPVVFFCIINQGVFAALTVINSFPVERTLTLRERASGTYYASAYFIAKIIAETLVQLPGPIIFVSKKSKNNFYKIIFYILVIYCLFSCWFGSYSCKVFYFYPIYGYKLCIGNFISLNDLCIMSNNRYECYCFTNGT
jgi:hypothetical protein